MGHLRPLKGRTVGEEGLRKEECCYQGGGDAEVKEGHRTGAALEQTADSEQ
jgi:hypothetical protein